MSDRQNRLGGGDNDLPFQTAPEIVPDIVAGSIAGRLAVIPGYRGSYAGSYPTRMRGGGSQ